MIQLDQQVGITQIVRLASGFRAEDPYIPDSVVCSGCQNRVAARAPQGFESYTTFIAMKGPTRIETATHADFAVSPLCHIPHGFLVWARFVEKERIAHCILL